MLSVNPDYEPKSSFLRSTSNIKLKYGPNSPVSFTCFVSYIILLK